MKPALLVKGQDGCRLKVDKDPITGGVAFSLVDSFLACPTFATVVFESRTVAAFVAGEIIDTKQGDLAFALVPIQRDVIVAFQRDSWPIVAKWTLDREEVLAEVLACL